MSLCRKSFVQNSFTAAGAVLVILLALVIARYLLPDELISNSAHRHMLSILPAGVGGHPQLLRWLLLIAAVPLFLWLIGVSTRR